MQNFTFGRKGTNWFLFAFVLLIGTLPSFGQDCPTVSDSDQEFCYLSTVADLQATPDGDGIVKPILLIQFLQQNFFKPGNIMPEMILVLVLLGR